ncbi:MAG: ATP-binding cassette domain-containing protein [Anaerolineales bacterium]|nr:ATP-binding cassette domain-containing protein [Anaerolineales bacterium]
MNSETQTLLEVRNLRKYFPIRKGLFDNTAKRQVKAVDDVSFFINKGETLGLVGESGSGKTTTGRTILRAYDPTSGEILFDTGDGQFDDVAQYDRHALKHFRRQAQMIFQDPYSSLSPRMTVRDIIGEPLVANDFGSRAEMDERVRSIAEVCGLKVEHLRRYPHAFSGGQRQRIGIARALAIHPKLVVCDEPVSALDVSIQAQILNLLKRLQQDLGLTYLFIAHDLSVVEHISDRVAVMYLGKIIELAETETLFRTPKHPYTEALMSAIPVADPHIVMDPMILQGEIPDPASPPSGCAFHPRCPYAGPECETETPAWREIQPGHFVSCHYADTLELVGVSALQKG